MKKMKALYLIIILLSLSLGSTAQNNHTQPLRPEDLSDDEIDMNRPTFEPKVRMGKVLDGKDSIPYVELNNVYVYPEPTFTDPRQRATYNRLVRNVKKVLPIAKEVNRIIVETYDYLQTLPNKKAKDQHLKFVEKSIREEYTPRMKKLSYQQGKLLIKLVYRECGNSAYGTLNAILGPVRAGFWQAFAWTFGASLTKKYDPNGVDKITERVVRQVESGQL
ncbi:MAG: DUF4294 domain-containing protein [Prevotella sp.]